MQIKSRKTKNRNIYWSDDSSVRRAGKNLKVPLHPLKLVIFACFFPNITDLFKIVQSFKSTSERYKIEKTGVTLR